VEVVDLPAPITPVWLQAEPANLNFDEVAAKLALDSPQTAAESFYEEGRYEEATETLLPAEEEIADSPHYSLLARSLANQGKLNDALAWCDRWIAAEKLNHAAHYLRAMVLLEQRAADLAQASLLRTLYLQPDFVLAHFALGNLARGQGKDEEAARHFANTLRLLKKHRPGDLLEESDGLTAGGLVEAVKTACVAINT
jgi:chemotaxis protein methyltransferase CheR